MHYLCENQSSFRPMGDKMFAITPFWKQINPEEFLLKDDPVSVTAEVQSLNPQKVTFLKDFLEDDVQKKMTSACIKVYWPRESAGKVQLKFECNHKPTHDIKKKWAETGSELFRKFHDEVEVQKITGQPETWGDVSRVVDSYGGQNVMIDKNDTKYTVVVIGKKDEAEFKKLMSDITSIKPPKQKQKKEIPIRDERKRKAFSVLKTGKFPSVISFDENNGKITIEADEDKIDTHLKEVEEFITSISIKEILLDDKDSIRSKIIAASRQDIEQTAQKSNLEVYFFEESPKKIIVFSANGNHIDKLTDIIYEAITEKEVRLHATIPNKQTLLDIVKKAKEQFTASINVEHDQEIVLFKIICQTTQFENLSKFLESETEGNSESVERIYLREETMKFFRDHKSPDIKGVKIESSKNVIEIFGTEDTKKATKQAIMKEISNVQSHWKCIAEGGIGGLVDDSIKQIEKLAKANKTRLKYAKKEELRDLGINCVGLLQTGQAVVVVTGDITDPSDDLVPDVIVNAANSDLRHGGGLARIISKKGWFFMKHVSSS